MILVGLFDELKLILILGVNIMSNGKLVIRKMRFVIVNKFVVILRIVCGGKKIMVGEGSCMVFGNVIVGG